MKKYLRDNKISAGSQFLQRLTTFADEKFHFFPNNLSNISLWSKEQKGREEGCPPSKLGRKAAKQKKFQKEQWPPTEKACKLGRYWKRVLLHTNPSLFLYLFLFFPSSFFSSALFTITVISCEIF